MKTCIQGINSMDKLDNASKVWRLPGLPLFTAGIEV